MTKNPPEPAPSLSALQSRADDGDPDAQFRLGVLYDTGISVPQNYTEAAAWYRKAAEQGLPSAQYNLGVLYSCGQGVPRSYTEAAAWYRKAAERANAVAQYDLGLLYLAGRGISQDYEEAYFWLCLAAASDPISLKARDRAAALLSPRQRDRVEERLRAWEPRTGAAD